MFNLRTGSKEGEKVLDRICSRMDVIAVTHDEHSNGWGRVLRFKDLVGREHEWAMPMSLAAGDGSEIRAELLDQGLNIEPFRQAGTRVIQYITSSAPSDTWLSVARPGWHGDYFIMPDETFGEGERRAVLQRERSFKHSFRVQGTLVEWQDNIGQYCVSNAYLAFAVSAAFAAPLLNITNEQGGGFHFRGDSSCGKSTTLEVAGSVVGGGGQNGYLTSWRATDNGLEGVGETHCDALLCLDEIGQADPKTIGQTAYMLSNGQGKIRASKSGSARAPAEWRLLFLSSGEESLASKMNESGTKTHAGMEVRLADIPVKGRWGVIDNLHGFSTSRDLINHLKKAAKRVYGHPIREYLRRLVKIDRVGVAETIAKTQVDFHEKRVPPDSGEQVGRVAKRFALVGAAGELATDMGLTGWKEGEATRAAAKCFVAWLNARGTIGNTEMLPPSIRCARSSKSTAQRGLAIWTQTITGWKTTVWSIVLAINASLRGRVMNTYCSAPSSGMRSVKALTIRRSSPC
jgi:putative DNA primase/helicase